MELCELVSYADDNTYFNYYKKNSLAAAQIAGNSNR